MGQTGATLGTTAGQHLAAIGSAHSLAEAMFLGPLALLGLIGTDHAIHLFLPLDFLWGTSPLHDGGAGLTAPQRTKSSLPQREDNV